MLTKGAIGNLVNRYRAVLKKCNLINTFGSLAVASMLVLGGAGVAGAEEWGTETITKVDNGKGGYNYGYGISSSETGYSGTKVEDKIYVLTDKTIAIDVAGNKTVTVSNLNKFAIIGDNNPDFVNYSTGNAIQCISGGTLDVDVTSFELGTKETAANVLVGIHTWDGTVDIDATNVLLHSTGNVLYTQKNNGDSEAIIDITAKENIEIISPKKSAVVAAAMRNNTHSGTADTNISSIRLSANNVSVISKSDGSTAVMSYNSGTNSTNASVVITGTNSVHIEGGEGVSVGDYSSDSTTARADISSSAGDVTIIGRAKDGLYLEDEYADGSVTEAKLSAKNVYITSNAANSIYNDNSSVSISTQNTLNLLGSTAGVYGKNNAKLTLAASDITIKGTNAIELTNGSTATLSADTYNITGDILIDAPRPCGTFALTRSTPASSKLVFNGGTGQVDGNINAETGGIDLNKGAELGLGDGSDNSIGELGGNGAFLLNDKNTKLAVNELASGSTAKAKATPKLNDELSGNAEEFKKQLKLGNNKAGVDVDALFGGMEEGLVAGAVDASGKQSKNRIMDAALKQASVATVALDKILTNDVRKRLGDIRSDKNQTGVWMRWDGGKLKGDGLTNNFNTIQIGGDTKVGTNCRIGVAGSFTHGDTDFARGNGELEGFSFALYSTWMGENGMFADIVTRLGHFSNEMNVEGLKGDMDNRVFSLSGEYGWRFDLCKQFFLEPQVELAYTYVSSDDLQLDTAHYEFDSVNSLTGRAGLVAGWNLPDDMGSVYARASVLQQFMGDAKIIGANGGKPITQEIDGNDTWMEYGIGANIKLTEKTYIWADVERTAGADLDEEWRGTVGLRYSF